MKQQFSRRQALGLALAAGAGSTALAQPGFPNRAVNIIVPFPPGGATDLIARPYGAALQRHWNQSVVLQNRGGAGGALGMNAGAMARPDGYTGVIAHVSYSSIPAADALFQRAASFERASLAPIALLTADPLIIVVKADAPWRNFQEFAEDAKRRPGEIAYGSSGPYSAVHLPFEMLAHAGGFRLNHVPYSGGGGCANRAGIGPGGRGILPLGWDFQPAGHARRRKGSLAPKHGGGRERPGNAPPIGSGRAGIGPPRRQGLPGFSGRGFCAGAGGGEPHWAGRIAPFQRCPARAARSISRVLLIGLAGLR